MAADNGGKIMTYVFMIFALVGAGFLFVLGAGIAVALGLYIIRGRFHNWPWD